jgi:hypothetical protein
MTVYSRGNVEALTDRMTDRVQSHRCMLHKRRLRRRSCAIRSQCQRTFHDLKRVEMTFVARAISLQTRWFYMQFLAEAVD